MRTSSPHASVNISVMISDGKSRVLSCSISLDNQDSYQISERLTRTEYERSYYLPASVVRTRIESLSDQLQINIDKVNRGLCPTLPLGHACLLTRPRVYDTRLWCQSSRTFNFNFLLVTNNIRRSGAGDRNSKGIPENTDVSYFLNEKSTKNVFGCQDIRFQKTYSSMVFDNVLLIFQQGGRLFP